MRRRIVALAVLAAVLATALFGIPLALGVGRYYVADERAELERLADTAAVAASADLVRGQPGIVLPPVETGTTVGVYDVGGQRLAGDGPAQSDQVTSQARDGAVADADEHGRLVVAVPVADNGRVVAVVRVSASKSALYRRIGLTGLLMVGLGTLAVLLTWLIARRQAAKLARPLEQLSVSTRLLGDGDFTVRASPSGIDEIDSVADSVNSTATRLGHLVAHEREFSADASHQLRTPLTGLRLQLEAAQRGSEPSTDAAIENALATVDRLDRTIEDLLALRRDIPANRVPLDISVLLDEVRAHWHEALAISGRPLRVLADSGLPASSASTPAVRQILGVLINNAVVHGLGQVTVHVRDAGSAVAIDVSDEGSGPTLPDDQIFLRRSMTDDGHGMGLALARSLAEAEGGRLTLNRSSAKFTLLVPVVREGPVPQTDR